jgi:transcriptional regulator with XRE-family HTH domain
MDSLTLSEFVAQRRKKLAKSQNGLANILSYTNQAISSFENGKTSPSISVLPSLADFLEMSLDDLLAKNPSPKPFEGKNPPFDGERIRKNIIALRNSQGLSQTQESAILGVSRRTIIHYENGSSFPSLDALEALLRHYGISGGSFFYEDLEEKLSYPSKKAAASSKKTLLFFIFGFLLGGAVLSALIWPLSHWAKTTPSTSSAPYQQGSSSSPSDSSAPLGGSASSPIPGLSKFVVITSSGQSRSASVFVGSSLTLTLYTEESFDFTDKTETAYTLTWALLDWGQDLSGVHLAASSPYPCETLSVDASFKPGAVFDVQATLQSKTIASRVMKSEPLTITVYQ